MARNLKLACIHLMTEEDVSKVEERDAKAKAGNNSYECPYCRRFIWWDEPHKHKLWEKIRV